MIKSGEVFSIPITFNLEDVRSGRYTGLLILLLDMDRKEIPITVSVHDKVIFPVLVLFMGVGLSLVLSIYKKESQPRDMIIVRVGNLRSQMREDESLSPYFLGRINSAFIDVEMALQTEKFEPALDAVTRAETWWARWRRGREDWMALFDYAKELEDVFNSEPFLRTSAVLEMSYDLKDVLRIDENMTGPHTLHQKLEAIGNRLRVFTDLDQLMGHVEELSEPFSDRNVAELRNKINRMEDDPKDLRKEVEAELVSLQKTPHKSASYGFGTNRRDINNSLSITSAPEVAMVQDEKLFVKAKLSLKTFKLITYVIAIFLLTGLGLNQLFFTNPTFGSNPWGDYFSLLLWGFGIQASGSAVTDLF